MNFFLIRNMFCDWLRSYCSFLSSFLLCQVLQYCFLKAGRNLSEPEGWKCCFVHCLDGLAGPRVRAVRSRNHLDNDWCTNSLAPWSCRLVHFLLQLLQPFPMSLSVSLWIFLSTNSCGGGPVEWAVHSGLSWQVNIVQELSWCAALVAPPVKRVMILLPLK